MTVESVLDQPLFGWNPIAGPGSTVTFDAENRVICLGSCTAPGVWTYTYDGDGKRVKKSNGSTGTLYWTGMGSDALSESDLSGNINEEYFYFSGQRVARADRPSNVVHYYVNDRLGTASIEATPVTHDTVTFSDSDYSPYGIQIPVAGSDSNHYKFMGKERDTETGLDNFGARYYASVLGRFMTPDWAARPTAVPYAVFGDPQSLNLYVFVRDNPVNHVDADGHECNKNNYTHQCNEHAEVQKQSLWARTVSAFTFSKSRTKEVNVVNENAVDNKTGLTANTKVVGASITGSISSNPANNKFNLSGGAEFHGLKSTMNFSSDPNGSNGMVNGIVKIDSFTAAASGSGGSDGGSMKGEAQVFTASGTTKAGSLTITGSFCLICAGGQLKATSTGAAVGVNYLIGADVSVDWGSSTILHASDTAK